MNIIKKAHLVWLFSAALALSAGAFTVAGNQVDAATTQSAYTVKSGDTLSEIAAANNVAIDDLVSTNHIQNKHLIMVGQQLQLQPAATATPATSSTYTVKAGDTLSAIAATTKVSVANLVAYNQIPNANMIHVGDVLKLTGTAVSTTQASVATPTQAPTTQASAKPAVTTTTQAPAKQATPATSSATQTTTSRTQTTTPAASTTATTSSTTDHGQFKLSFYDPAVLGSSLGYGGVAANLSVFPKGTRLKITLSNGTVWYRTVNDTGTFAYSNPRQLDVAMPNNAIPSAGILYANVSVVK